MATSLAPTQADAFAVPDYVEPLEAWRVWRVDMRAERPALQSAFADESWEPGVPLCATCAKQHRPLSRPWRMEPSRHVAPDIACTCGIYGLRSLAAARWYLESHAFLGATDRVIGRVALWGDVVVSEGGWRASFAYPIELFVPSPMLRWRVISRRARLAIEETVLALERYHVPVDVLETDVALAL